MAGERYEPNYELSCVLPRLSISDVNVKVLVNVPLLETASQPARGLTAQSV